MRSVDWSDRVFMGQVAGRQMRGLNSYYDKSVWGKIVARNTASQKLPPTTYEWQEKRSTARRVVKGRHSMAASAKKGAKGHHLKESSFC